MTERLDTEPYIIYPESQLKWFTDLIVAIFLISCCFWTPWELCFDVDTRAATIFNWSIDVIFLLDMIVTFFSAYSNEDYEVITDHKEIAFNYLTGNFWIDLLAILPFQNMIGAFKEADENDGGSSSETGSLGFVRILRLNRLSKFVKLLKIFRVIKFFKKKTHEHISKSVARAGFATERLAFFVLVTILGFHLCNCLWLWSATFFDVWYEDTWLLVGGYEELSEWTKYGHSAYQTVVMSCGATVAENEAEQLL